MRSPRLFALVIGVGSGALITLQPIADSDLFWHVATGARTLAGDLPRSDLFSWTISGAPVYTDQWLGDALLALARAIGDWRGVLALRALAVAALVTIIVDAALAARPRAPTVAILAALPAIALSRFAWTDRPELLGLLLFALLLRLLRGGDRMLLLTIPVVFVWSQLHGSYALGLALVLASCGARAIEEPGGRWRLAAIAAAAAATTVLTPAGLATWTSSGGHFLAPPRYIAEEGVPDLRTLPGVLFIVTLVLLVATAMLGRRATLREAMLLIPVALVSLTATRHMPLLAIAAAAYFAANWPDPLARWRAIDGQAARRREGFGRAAAYAIAAVVLTLAVARADGRVDESGYPRGALAALPAGPGLLNQYDWGGYLIEFAPRTPVFIDGRLFPFVPDVLDDYRTIVGAHPDWERVAQRRGVRAILVRPGDPIAIRAPERGWRVVYADDVAVLLLR